MMEHKLQMMEQQMMDMEAADGHGGWRGRGQRCRVALSPNANARRLVLLAQGARGAHSLGAQTVCEADRVHDLERF